MAFHSEEVWESIDALWRRMQMLGRQVKEMEARLAMLEAPGGSDFRTELKAVRAAKELELTDGRQRRD